MSVADRIRQQTAENLLRLREEEIARLKESLKTTGDQLQASSGRELTALQHVQALITLLDKHNIEDPILDEARILVGDKKLKGEFSTPPPE